MSLSNGSILHDTNATFVGDTPVRAPAAGPACRARSVRSQPFNAERRLCAMKLSQSCRLDRPPDSRARETRSIRRAAAAVASRVAFKATLG